MGRLSGKAAIVTGAGSGIGEATAHLLAGYGAGVVVAAHRPESAERVAGEIRARGLQAAPVAGDVSEEAVARAAVEAALSAFGRIDVVHNNAAATGREQMNRDVEVTGFEPEVWSRAMAVNVYGPALLCKHAIPHMIRQGGGSIIMTSSGRGLQGDVGFPAYGASKAALMNLSANIAAQYGKQGIRCNSIIVGFVLTAKNEAGVPPELKAMLERHHLTPYVGKPDHVAELVAFLASDESAFITGAAIPCDGGITTHGATVADLQAMQLKLVPDAI